MSAIKSIIKALSLIKSAKYEGFYERLQSDITSTIDRNDLVAIKKISATYGYCMPESDQISIIQYAVGSKHYDAFYAMLESGFNPNLRRQKNDISLLYNYASLRDFEAVKILIKHGADVNSLNVKGHDKTPLMAACNLGDFAIAKLLLDAKADPNSFAASNLTNGKKVLSGTVGQNALMSAVDAKENRIQCINLLLDYGADIHAKNDIGIDLIDYANLKGDQEVIEFLGALDTQKILDEQITGDQNLENDELRF